MEPRQWPAIIAFVLLALAQQCRALAFTTKEWTLERGSTINITWSETGGNKIGMSVYYTRTIPGRFESPHTIDRTLSLSSRASRTSPLTQSQWRTKTMRMNGWYGESRMIFQTAFTCSLHGVATEPTTGWKRWEM